MPEIKPDSLTPQVDLHHVIHMFRYWMAKNNIPGADKVKFEVTFPSPHSQHVATAYVMRELSAAYPDFRIGPVTPHLFIIEGVSVVFSNPERLDRRS